MKLNLFPWDVVLKHFDPFLCSPTCLLLKLNAKLVLLLRRHHYTYKMSTENGAVYSWTSACFRYFFRYWCNLSKISVDTDHDEVKRHQIKTKLKLKLHALDASRPISTECKNNRIITQIAILQGGPKICTLTHQIVTNLPTFFSLSESVENLQ